MAKLTIILKDKDFTEVDATDAALRGEALPEHGGCSVAYKYDFEKASEELVQEIAVDPLSFDSALQLVAEQIRSGNPVPLPLREWAANVILGKVQKPKSPGKIKGATIQRDRLILGLLDMLVDDVGLSPTSGDRRNGQSACHAVAQAFSLLHLQPDSYESILNVWRRRDSGELRGNRLPGRV